MTDTPRPGGERGPPGGRRPRNERPFVLLAVGYAAVYPRVQDIRRKTLDDIARRV